MPVRPAQSQVVDAPDAGPEPLGDLTDRLATCKPAESLGSAFIVEESSRVRPVAGDRSVDLGLTPGAH